MSMGLLNGLIGNASSVPVASVQKEIEPLLIESEIVENAFRLVRDLVIFTNKRLILSDIQGFTGKKVEYKSIAYHSITRFSTETSGHFDLDGEVKIWISGQTEPSEKIQFKKGQALTEVQKLLAQKVL